MTDADNKRRAELIDKLTLGTMTFGEFCEFERLQQQSLDSVKHLRPPSDANALDELEVKLKEMEMAKVTGFVVLYTEHLRDGRGDEGALCFPTSEKAVEWMNKERYGCDNYTYQMFHLGDEIPLSNREVEEHVVEKVTVKKHTVYGVAK